MNMKGDLEALILRVVEERFDLDDVQEIKIGSIEVDDLEQTIRVEIFISATAEPKKLASRYFGLTGQVREAIGADWSGFFPILTPRYNSEAHA